MLLVLIGSDLSMMEALNSYGRPFHQRAREMVLGPLNPAEVGRMLGLDPAEAFDAALVTGGLPLICAEWPRGAGLWDFLNEALSDPVSALLVSAERSLAAEFPPRAQARTVLAAIGSGERTFTNIARAAGCPTISSPLPAAPAVGGYWTRTNDVEIDIIGADRAPIAKELLFLGSIKWLEESPFDRHDLAALHRYRAALTDEPVPVVAVSRGGVESPGLDATYGPGDLLTAWPL